MTRKNKYAKCSLSISDRSVLTRNFTLDTGDNLIDNRDYQLFLASLQPRAQMSQSKVIHNVIIEVKESASQAEVDAFFNSLVALKENSLIPGILSVTYGPNESPEGLSKGFNYGFSIVFESSEARDNYLPHPEHEKVKALIGPLLKDGANSVIVVDWKMNH